MSFSSVSPDFHDIDNLDSDIKTKNNVEMNLLQAILGRMSCSLLMIEVKVEPRPAMAVASTRRKRGAVKGYQVS